MNRSEFPYSGLQVVMVIRRSVGCFEKVRSPGTGAMTRIFVSSLAGTISLDW